MVMTSSSAVNNANGVAQLLKEIEEGQVGYSSTLQGPFGPKRSE